MTKEEAIFCEKSYIGETSCIDCKYYITDTCSSRESHKMAVKALEQDSILDKVRAEIEALPKTYPFVNHFDTYVKEDDVKRIIDKYKAESEE
jgi:hypothetical protein